MDLTTNLLSQCGTKTQALRLLEEWEDLVRGKLFGEKTSLVDSSGFDLEKIAGSLTKQNYQQEFEATLKTLSEMEPLYIYVPKGLAADDLAKIVAKLRKDYGKNFLTEIKVQGDLIGGCCLSYKGVFKDYSIKNKLNSIKPMTNINKTNQPISNVHQSPISQ